MWIYVYFRPSIYKRKRSQYPTSQCTVQTLLLYTYYPPCIRKSKCLLRHITTQQNLLLLPDILILLIYFVSGLPTQTPEIFRTFKKRQERCNIIKTPKMNDNLIFVHSSIFTYTIYRIIIGFQKLITRDFL